MNFNIFRWWSLKTKITLFTLAIFLIGIWSLAFYTSYTLHNDMEKALGEQQFSTVSILASDINTNLDDRLKVLEKVAAIITPAILGNAATRQRFLEERPDLETMFSGGVYVIQLDGTVIADFPLSAGRLGLNYFGRDYIVEVFKGKTTISKL